MRKALFTGSFNPPSLGHLDIIQRASKICDVLVVGIANNVSKQGRLFSISERLAMLKEITKGIANVEVASFPGLVVDFVESNQINYIVRGLRAFCHYEQEFLMAMANRKMCGVETLFFAADPKYSHVSSQLIREIGGFGRRLHEFVPEEIEDIVFQRISEKT